MLSVVILAAIIALLANGMTHPFFRSVGNAMVRDLARQAVQARRAGLEPSPEAERARRAVAVRIATIGAYWTLCFGLTGVLLVLAWLDVREIRRKLLAARMAALRTVADARRRGGSNGHGARSC